MARSPSSDGLICPACGATHPASERFCSHCRIPLVHPVAAGEAELSARQELARKIKPQLAEGELVKVAGARNQAEAEFVQGMLLEEGVPSTLRRSRGFDVPDMLAAGPRDVFVPASGVMTAREVLLDADLHAMLPSSRSGHDAPARVLIGVLVAFALVGLIAWLGTELLA